MTMLLKWHCISQVILCEEFPDISRMPTIGQSLHWGPRYNYGFHGSLDYPLWDRTIYYSKARRPATTYQCHDEKLSTPRIRIARAFNIQIHIGIPNGIRGDVTVLDLDLHELYTVHCKQERHVLY